VEGWSTLYLLICVLCIFIIILSMLRFIFCGTIDKTLIKYLDIVQICDIQYLYKIGLEEFLYCPLILWLVHNIRAFLLQFNHAFHTAHAMHAHPAIKANPPKGVIMPNHFSSVILSM